MYIYYGDSALKIKNYLHLNSEECYEVVKSRYKKCRSCHPFTFANEQGFGRMQTKCHAYFYTEKNLQKTTTMNTVIRLQF